MRKKVGAYLSNDNSAKFTLWAPLAETAALMIGKKTYPLKKMDKGYFTTTLENIKSGTRYKYKLDDMQPLPDPASFSQPEGVHEASEVIDLKFKWTDKKWGGINLKDYIIYELHPGTFTQEGNFDGIISKLDYLANLGITAIELMPVASFPGERNWGYDGVYPFAVHQPYGGPKKLQELVNECHNRGIAVILDVVYNHFGPEGNYSSQFGPYFTDKYNTPWGKAINFDDQYSDQVRNYFIQNALFWLKEFHIDALRLDAIHAIMDNSAKPFLRQLALEVEEVSFSSWKRYLFPESDLNDPKLLKSFDQNGFQHDAQWLDDFHHALHTVVTNEKQGYYMDYGRLSHLEKSFNNGYVYSGEYSEFRKKSFGEEPDGLKGINFIVFSQNHDQIGNRMLGERLASMISFEKLKLVAGCLFVSQFIPLIFMGEEYGEDSPFLYFISHTDPKLVEAVRKGRKKEFKGFNWKGKVPDPQAEETFQKSRLKWETLENEKNKKLFGYYKAMIRFQKENPIASIENLGNGHAKTINNHILEIDRGNNIKCFLNFAEVPQSPGSPPENHTLILDSSSEEFGGPGSEFVSTGLLSPSSLTILKEYE